MPLSFSSTLIERNPTGRIDDRYGDGRPLYTHEPYIVVYYYRKERGRIYYKSTLNGEVWYFNNELLDFVGFIDCKYAPGFDNREDAMLIVSNIINSCG